MKIKLRMTVYWLFIYFVSCTHGRKSGGGGGGPHVFFRWGTQYQMSPPRFGVGWILVDIMLFLFLKLFWPFFFFFACQKCSWCGLGTPTHFDLCDFRRRWRSGKKVSESPPPPPPSRKHLKKTSLRKAALRMP